MAGRDTLLISAVAAAVSLSVSMLEVRRMVFVTRLYPLLWMDLGFGIPPLRKEMHFRLLIQMSPTSIFFYKFFPVVRIDRMYIYEVRGTCWIILLVFSTAVLCRHRTVDHSKLVRTPSSVPASRWKLWRPDCLRPTILAGYTSVPGRPVVTLPCSIRGID